MKTKNISFRLVEPSDARFILSLRADPAKNKYISATSENLEKQISWINNYQKREIENQEFYYIIQDNSKVPIGTVRLYDFKENSFCWGSWMIIDESPIFSAIESALLVYEIGFYKLNFEQSHFDVRKDNISVLNFHIKFGAEKTSSDELNQCLKLSKETYKNTKLRYKRFF